MKMQRKIIIAVFTLALLVVVGYNVHSQLVPKPLHPFFVYMTQISLAGLREPPNQPQIPFVYASGRAIREDGSSVEVSHSFSPEESGRRDIFGEQKAIFDFSTMRRITVNDTAESTTTTGLVHHDIALSKIVPRAHCGTPAGKMLGYDVEYWEDNTPAVSTKDGTEKPMEDHQKFWGAPALGCYALRKEEKSNWPDGSVFMDSIEQALYVTEGDVRKYFEIPPRYKEMSPSEVMAEVSRKYPDIPMETTDLLNRADENYRRGQRWLEHPPEEH
jgi:hypothetical protein